MQARSVVVNLQPRASIPVIKVSQYDVGVPLSFVVYDGSVPASFSSGTSVTFEMTRPSGVGVVTSCSIAGNVVSKSTTLDMTREAGDITAELRFASGGTDVGTCNFTFAVEEAAHPDGTIDAETEVLEAIAQQVHADTVQSTNNASIASSAAALATESANSADQNAETAVAAARSAALANQSAQEAKMAAESAADAAESHALNTVRYDVDQQRTETEKARARGNIGAADADNAVRYDLTQSHTDVEKLTARENIGAASETSVVKHDADQNLTNAQKETARNNIGAVGTSSLDGKLNLPINGNGRVGQILTSDGNGNSVWENPVIPTDEKMEELVNTWLEEHPEATTTVEDDSITEEKIQDGAVTESKLDEALKDKLESQATGLPDTLPLDVLYNKLWYASDDDYCVLQGACAVDGSLYACFSAVGNEASIKMRVFNLSTFEVTKQAALAINHGNNVTHKDGKLYVGDLTNKIHVVNISSLAIESTKNLDYMPVGLCINAVGNLIVVHSGFTITEYSLPDFTVIHTYNALYTELKHGANQFDIEYSDGYYYVCLSGPTSIYVYDDNFDLVKCIDIRERYDRVTLRETEFITYLGDGDFLIGWNTILLPSSRITSYPVVEQVSFTKTNFKKGNSNNKEQNIEDAYSPNAAVSIYVNKNYTGDYSDGSWQFPYKEVQQALDNVNIDSALYNILIKPGLYLPVYAVDKQALFGTWPNQPTTERLQDVTINSIILINSNFNIGKVALTEHAATGNVALRVDANSFCMTERDSTDPEYTVLITLGGVLETRGYPHTVTSNGGLWLFNSNSKRSWNYTKNLAVGKILGRAGMYTGDSRSGTITLSHGKIDSYVFVIASVTIEGHMFKGLLDSNVTIDIPFEYYSSGNRVYGVVELVTTADTIATTLTCYKGSSAYTPNSFNLLVEGAI